MKPTEALDPRRLALYRTNLRLRQRELAQKLIAVVDGVSPPDEDSVVRQIKRWEDDSKKTVAVTPVWANALAAVLEQPLDNLRKGGPLDLTWWLRQPIRGKRRGVILGGEFELAPAIANALEHWVPFTEAHYDLNHHHNAPECVVVRVENCYRMSCPLDPISERIDLRRVCHDEAHGLLWMGLEDFEREDIEETLKDLLLERFDCISLLGQQLPARADAVRFRVTIDLLTVLHGQEPTTKKHIEFFEDEGVFHAICAWINGRTWSSSEPAPTFSERGAAIFGERQEVDRDRFVRSQYTIERVEPDGNNWRRCPWARRQRRHYLDRLNQPESAMVWLEDWGEMPNFRDEV